jgi:hypothetical protein
METLALIMGHAGRQSESESESVLFPCGHWISNHLEEDEIGDAKGNDAAKQKDE